MCERGSKRDHASGSVHADVQRQLWVPAALAFAGEDHAIRPIAFLDRKNGEAKDASNALDVFVGIPAIQTEHRDAAVAQRVSQSSHVAAE